MGADSTTANPDVTRQRASVPGYGGFVLRGGVAAINNARACNIGLATGFERLMGADGPYWVYRRKPWGGNLFGLDLN